MQLLTAALDVAVVSGRYGYRVDEHTDDADERLHRVRRPVTRNALSDAVMRRWSDHARLAREEKRAFAITQMTETTARNCWRDLLVQEIHLQVLWEMVTKVTPLFGARASRFDVSRRAGTGTVTGYDISLRRGDVLKMFERLVRKDRVYGPSRVRHTWRLWVVGRRRPIVDIPAPIVAERKHNQVIIGDKTREVLRLQENSRLMFDTRMFVTDYRAVRAEWRRVRREIREKFPTKTTPKDQPPEESKLRKAQGKLQAFIWEYRSVYEQAVPLQTRIYKGSPFPGTVPIRSSFYKVVNRRYQAPHFWLTQVSGRTDQIGRELRADDDEVPDEQKPYLLNWFGSPRARWFGVRLNPVGHTPDMYSRFPGTLPWSLVSMDISASQTQIQAILLGIEDMEQDAVLSRLPHKVLLAKRAWAAREGRRPTGRVGGRARARAEDGEALVLAPGENGPQRPPPAQNFDTPASAFEAPRQAQSDSGPSGDPHAR